MSSLQAMEQPVALVDSFSVFVDDLVIALDDREEVFHKQIDVRMTWCVFY